MSVELADDAAHDSLATIAEEYVYTSQQEEIPVLATISLVARGMEALSLDA